MNKPMTLESAKKRIGQLEELVKNLSVNVRKARLARDEEIQLRNYKEVENAFLLDGRDEARERVKELDAVVAAQIKRADTNERKYQAACAMIRVLLEG